MNTSQAPLNKLATNHLALLVDRDDDTRQMYAEFLRHGPWTIEEASDGREALAKAIARRPDIVITETRLPGINGYDLCGLLRRDAATRDIPIIVVTADAYAADVQHARDAGADTVLVKPCLPEQLADEIVRVFEISQGSKGARRRYSRAGGIGGLAREGARDQVARNEAGGSQPRASAARYDDAADRAARPRVPAVRPGAQLPTEPRRRRQRAARGAVGLFRVPDRLRQLPVPGAHAQAAQSFYSGNSTTRSMKASTSARSRQPDLTSSPIISYAR